MKRIYLTYDQSKKLMFDNKQIKVRRNGVIYYVEHYVYHDEDDNEISGFDVRNWVREVKDVQIVPDEMFRD